MSRFLIACGGTGGHLAPGIALAEALLARGHEPRLLISHKRVDARLAERYPHLPIARVPGAPFSPRPDRLARCVWHQARGFGFSRRYLAAFRPHAVVGFGGFTTAAITLAARLRRIPVALHEANRVPGRAVRLLARWCQRVYLPPGVRLGGPADAAVRPAGLPVRVDVVPVPRGAARAALGVDPLEPLLFVLGGSQGSSRLNSWVESNVAALAAAGVQVWCVTGLGKGAAEVRELPTSSGATVRAWFEPFSDRVGTLLAAADLVVSRAGAGTLAELVRCGAPAVLVPFPEAADDHQRANARYFAEQGGGLVCDEAAFDRLLDEVLALLRDEARRELFRANLRRAAATDDTAALVADLEQLASAGSAPAFPRPNPASAA